MHAQWTDGPRNGDEVDGQVRTNESERELFGVRWARSEDVSTICGAVAVSRR